MDEELVNNIREAIGEKLNIDIDRIKQLEEITIDILNERELVDDILGDIVEKSQNMKEVAFISLMAGLMINHYHSDDEEGNNQSMYI